MDKSRKLSNLYEVAKQMVLTILLQYLIAYGEFP